MMLIYTFYDLIIIYSPCYIYEKRDLLSTFNLYFLLESQTYGEKDLPTIALLLKQSHSTELCQYEARSQEVLLGLSHGYRISGLWAILYCFPTPRAGC